MAFRRRRRFTKRFGGSRLKRKTLAWDHGYFTTALDLTGVAGTVIEQVLFDPQSWPGTGSIVAQNYNKELHIKRVIAKGNVIYEVQSAAFTQANAILGMAIYTIDRDDSDADILGGPAGSNIFDNERVVWFDEQCARITEATTGQVAVEFGPRIDVDLKFPIKVKNDQYLVLGYEFGLPVNTVLNAALACISSRVLFEMP